MDMDPALLKALIAFIPVCVILAGALVLYVRARTGPTVLQLLGACGLVIVVLTHVCEALNFLPWMGWGREGSAGHYLDLTAAAFGVTCFPLGFLLHALRYRPGSDNHRKKGRG